MLGKHDVISRDEYDEMISAELVKRLLLCKWNVLNLTTGLVFNELNSMF